MTLLELEDPAVVNGEELEARFEVRRAVVVVVAIFDVDSRVTPPTRIVEINTIS